MKKMSVKATQQANGGYQKCNYCGHTFRNTLCVRLHQRCWCNGGLNYVFHGFNYSWSWKKGTVHEWWI